MSKDDGGPLGQAVDKFLTRKKAKGIQKQTGQAKQAKSGCFPHIYGCFINHSPENKPLATGDKMDSEFAKKFTYNIAIFSEKECSKDFKKKTGKNTYMVLNNNEPFNTWKAQIIV